MWSRAAAANRMRGRAVEGRMLFDRLAAVTTGGRVTGVTSTWPDDDVQEADTFAYRCLGLYLISKLDGSQRVAVRVGVPDGADRGNVLIGKEGCDFGVGVVSADSRSHHGAAVADAVGRPSAGGHGRRCRVILAREVNPYVCSGIGGVLAEGIGGPARTTDQPSGILGGGTLDSETTTAEEGQAGHVEPRGYPEEVLLHFFPVAKTVGYNVVDDDHLGEGRMGGGGRGSTGRVGIVRLGVVRRVVPGTVHGWVVGLA